MLSHHLFNAKLNGMVSNNFAFVFFSKAYYLTGKF